MTAAPIAESAPAARRHIAHRQVYTPPPFTVKPAPAAAISAVPTAAASTTAATAKAASTLTLSSLNPRQIASAAYSSTGFNFHFGGYGGTDIGA